MSTGDLSQEAQPRYAYIARLLAELVPPPADLVDLGAAPGDQAAQLAAKGYRVTAVDIDMSADAWANGEVGRMRTLLDRSGVALVTCNLEEPPYPFADETCDAIIFTEVIEHLREYPVASLRECARILRPGGVVVLTSPNQAYLMNRLRLLVGRNVQTPLQDWIGGEPYARHAREYTVSELAELVTTAGLHVVSITSRHFHAEHGSAVKRSMKVAIDQLAQRAPTLGPITVLVARR